MNEGMTDLSDFLCEQPGLYNQSYSCKWCQKIFHCIDVHSPTQAHGWCYVKKNALEDSGNLFCEWTDDELDIYTELHKDE